MESQALFPAKTQAKFFTIESACSRAVLVTVGQLCFYDVIKEKLLETGSFGDDTRTHLLSSVTAVSGTPEGALHLIECLFGAQYSQHWSQ